MDRLGTLFHPAHFQSAGRRGGWFEGWYFKLVDADGRHPVAIIPGVAHRPDPRDSHAFVQVLRPGVPAAYHRYPFSAFTWETDRLSLCVGPNRFTSEGLTIDLPAHGGARKLRGWVGFGELREWPVSVLSPGIMGWYRYVPRMECYHAVVSMDHALTGTLRHDSETLSFDGGRGYAEKDWGSSFPSSWVWLQTNRFVDDAGRERPGVSLTCSVAKIPWLGSSFVGHIAGLLLDDGRLFRFATYTGSRLVHVQTGDGHASIALADRGHRLEVEVDGVRPGQLKAPVDGAMIGHADEALDARIRVRLTTHEAALVFSGTGTCSGAEVMDDKQELQLAAAPERDTVPPYLGARGSSAAP